MQSDMAGGWVQSDMAGARRARGAAHPLLAHRAPRLLLVVDLDPHLAELVADAVRLAEVDPRLVDGFAKALIPINVVKWKYRLSDSDGSSIVKRVRGKFIDHNATTGKPQEVLKLSDMTNGEHMPLIEHAEHTVARHHARSA